MWHRFAVVLLRFSFVVLVAAVATSGKAYGQYWSSVYVCPGASMSPVNPGWTGECELDGNGYMLGLALVGLYAGASSAAAISFADESYQVLELHARISAGDDTAFHSRFCDYQVAATIGASRFT